MLPFQPETISQMQSRFKYALLYSWVPAENAVDRPGLHRENVFDFVDGIRIIVSKDILKGKGVVHFSGSLNKDTFRGPVDKWIIQRFVLAFMGISGYKGKCKMVTVSENGIPHFLATEYPL